MTFAPNFLLSKLAKDLSASASKLSGSVDLSSLQRINSGGEAVVTSTVKAFCEALNAVRAPGLGDLTVEVAAGFGMTETWLAVFALCILLDPDFFTAPVRSTTVSHALSPTPGIISPPPSFCPLVAESAVWRCVSSPLRMVALSFVTESLVNSSSVAQ